MSLPPDGVNAQRPPALTVSILRHTAAFWYLFILTKLEFGLKDLRRCTFQMEHFINNHWSVGPSVALKCEKLNDILLEKHVKFP